MTKMQKKFDAFSKLKYPHGVLGFWGWSVGNVRSRLYIRHAKLAGESRSTSLTKHVNRSPGHALKFEKSWLFGQLVVRLPAVPFVNASWPQFISRLTHPFLSCNGRCK